MPPAIVRDHTVSFTVEEHHLVVPVVRRQRPAMMEDDRLRVLRTPILVKNISAVFGRDEWHGGALPLKGVRPSGPVPVSGGAATSNHPPVDPTDRLGRETNLRLL